MRIGFAVSLEMSVFLEGKGRARLGEPKRVKYAVIRLSGMVAAAGSDMLGGNYLK